jgi:hypothetical protein
MRSVSLPLDYVIFTAIQLIEKEQWSMAMTLLREILPQVAAMKDADCKDQMIETLNRQRIEAEAGRQRALKDLRNIFNRCRVTLTYASEQTKIVHDHQQGQDNEGAIINTLRSIMEGK